jgi:hypothetical protein
MIIAKRVKGVNILIKRLVAMQATVLVLRKRVNTNKQ